MQSIESFVSRGLCLDKVVVLTGAGVSVASGLPTYRGPGGLWTNDPGAEKQLVAGVAPEVVWNTLGALREKVRNAAPNPAHEALAAFETWLTKQGKRFHLITQNVDGLHQRAGSKSVIELHGSLFRTRCSSMACTSEPFDDAVTYERVPLCVACGAPLRPAVVLFEEPLGAREDMDSKRALRDCTLFVAIGTSGVVWPAASFVRSARYENAHTIFVNRTPLERDEKSFHETILGAAEELVPKLFAVSSSGFGIH